MWVIDIILYCNYFAFLKKFKPLPMICTVFTYSLLYVKLYMHRYKDIISKKVKG